MRYPEQNTMQYTGSWPKSNARTHYNQACSFNPPMVWSAKLPVLDGVTLTMDVLPFYLTEIISTFENKRTSTANRWIQSSCAPSPTPAVKQLHCIQKYIYIVYRRGLQPTRLLCPWDSPGKDTGAGCHFLLQGNFLTQGSNRGLLHCRQILYRLSY